MTTEKTKIINEVKEITANAVAKKQDAAKLNFPKIIEEIKYAAALGDSQVTVSESRMNEYDKDLLQKEGFSVSLIDEPKSKWSYNDFMQSAYPKKVWQIRW
jgi:hypothetical protein